MNKRIGQHLIKKTPGETYKVYIPPALQPIPPIQLDLLYPLIEKATIVLEKLNNVTKSIPNTSLFIYMYVRKEALLSSQIEGTQSSFSDLILFEQKQKTNIAVEDVEEVSNYVQSINYGLKQLKTRLPLSLRLLREIHGILLSGSRGSKQSPGEFRKSQNWIGGTRPGNAIFVPPPPEYMVDCLSDFEKFLHDKTLPTLVKAGIAHVQFETIHPFLDGNGRLGRLLIILILCDNNLIEEPVLYLSLYLKENRNRYYELLQEVRLKGNWETWLEFFLIGVSESATQALSAAEAMNLLFAQDLRKISSLGRARFSCEQTLEYLKQLPQLSVPILSKGLGITAPTARVALNQMVRLGILEEISGKKRDKIYVYRNYLNILETGTKPFSI
jgi:Fic family protein